jgi:hypothetical protein
MAITEQDRQDYPYIVGHCLYFGSYSYWTEDQIRLAREYNAPRTTERIEYVQRTDKVKLWDALDGTPEWKERLKREMDFHGLDHSEISD